MSAVLENSFTDKTFRYDIETYHKLSATGILPRNTELIHGVVVKKMTISPKHSKVVTKGKTNYNWRLRTRDRYFCRRGNV